MAARDRCRAGADRPQRRGGRAFRALRLRRPSHSPCASARGYERLGPGDRARTDRFKLDGQRRILVRFGSDLREFDMLGAALDTADSIERMRVIEANAAAL